MAVFKMPHNRGMIGVLLFIACLGNIASVSKAARVQTASRGFPGSAELLQHSPDENKHFNRQVRSNHFNGISAEILNQNYNGDNRNNINHYRRSRVNAEFATDSPAAEELVPLHVATTATKTLRDEEEHSSSRDGGQVADKRKLLLSNLQLFNGTDTKNLTDSQKMLLIQIADRVARYGENNLFRELVNAQQQQKSEKEGQTPDEGRANSKPDSPTTVTKKAKPSKRPHAAVHNTAPSTLSSATPSKTTTTTTTKRQPLPTGDSTVSVTPTKSSTKSKIRPNTSFTPTPVDSSPVTPSVANTQSLSTPSEAEKKSTTAATSRHTKKPPGSVEDIIYDYNVTASALIESLSKPNPTSNSLLYQQTLHPAAVNKQSVNSDSNKVSAAVYK